MIWNQSYVMLKSHVESKKSEMIGNNCTVVPLDIIGHLAISMSSFLNYRKGISERGIIT